MNQRLRKFRDPIARDAAWGRFFARMGLRAIERVTRRPEPTPTNAERIEAWRQKYARTTVEQQIGERTEPSAAAAA